jgi:predicted TPR repeat methyltransferase
MPVELRPEDAGLAQLVSDTDVLLRLQNNLKLRALDAGDSPRGLEVARRMVLIAPRRPDLWFDLARLNEAVGVLGAARDAYGMCLELAPPGRGLHNEAAISLAQLKRRLN